MLVKLLRRAAFKQFVCKARYTTVYPKPLPAELRRMEEQSERRFRENVVVEPIKRFNESLATKRARLLYQSRKRGILEMDLLCSTFAKLWLSKMSSEELDQYDKFLDEPDWDLYYWIIKSPEAPRPCPEQWENSTFMARLRDIASNHKGPFRMPEL